MINYTPIPEERHDHFLYDGSFIGNLNINESIVLRLNICQEGIDGCYIVFEGQKIFINEYGRIIDWPKGLYDFYSDKCVELMFLSVKKKRLKRHV